MRALVAMSGGVDSAVSALLTQRLGWECVGCTMKLTGIAEAGDRTCCTADDAADARSVAYRLGMKHWVFNYTREFERDVVERFRDRYRRGMTPNPCIDCNRYLKFGALLERARILDCDRLVTGHYARISSDGDRYRLMRAKDKTKDQSYVLFNLTQDQLSRVYFPLGELTKTEVREIAAENGFVNAHKPDSQDICFVPDGDYASVVGESPAGDFVDASGKVLGRHRGITAYTVGQRRGLNIPFGERMYVVKIEPETNRVVLGKESELYTKEFTVGDANWIAEKPSGELRCTVMTRYRGREGSARVIPTDTGARVIFDEPQRAVTPGQAAVFYDGDQVLGGGVIERRDPGGDKG